MQKARKNNGFTLAEALIVVGIVVVLMGVAFVSVISYMRSMTKLEYDGYAREIFIAAQNHLSVAESQGYLGRTVFGTEDPSEDGVYYFVVNGTGGASAADRSSVLNLMLPTASVDETLRMGGRYIVRYHKDSGQVLDVFYWSDSGRYSHDYAGSDYALFLSKRGEEKKDQLKKYEADNSVIGWYGGAAALAVPSVSLRAPTLHVVNANTLHVTIRDPNSGVEALDGKYTLKLLITGLSSRAEQTVLLDGNDGRIAHTAGTYTVTLDDVTTPGMHFRELESKDPTLKPFLPGEDIRLQAVAEGKAAGEDAVFAVPRYAVGVGPDDGKVTNSLFGWDSDAQPVGGTAKIASFRHLENLDRAISGVNADGAAVKFGFAEQTTNLDWNSFYGGTASVYPLSDPLEAGHGGYPLEGGAGSLHTAAGEFLAVTPGVVLSYDGKSHTISNVRISAGSENAGLFGTLSGGRITNLELLDFDVSGGNAGTLAGSTAGTEVENVLAIQTRGDDHPPAVSVTGSGSVGGLIGSVSGGRIEKCAAALTVESAGGDAGGLLGTVADTSTGTLVSACYSGGHTENGKYTGEANVRGADSVGGLIGSFTVAAGGGIENSYSTCSASGGIVGGFLGTVCCAAAEQIRNCYAAGLVGGTVEGAFAGDDAGSAAGWARDCRYYEIVNELYDAQAEAEGRYEDIYTYLGPVGGEERSGLAPLDDTSAAYEGFVGESGAGSEWTHSVACDSILNLYYSGYYPLQGIPRLDPSVTEGFVAVHYGDWPAPELWVINEVGD